MNERNVVKSTDIFLYDCFKKNFLVLFLFIENIFMNERNIAQLKVKKNCQKKKDKRTKTIYKTYISI